MFTDVTSRYDAADIAANKGVAALACVPILFWLPLVCCSGSRFARFYANNGLMLLLVGVVGGTVLGWVPLVGNFLRGVLELLLFVVIVYELVMAAQGYAKKIPLLSDAVLIKEKNA